MPKRAYQVGGFRPAPLREEALASWAARTALGFGLSVGSYLQQLGIGSLGAAGRGGDSRKRVLESLARSTRRDMAELSALTTTHLARDLLGESGAREPAGIWLIRHSLYLDIRRGQGLPYCRQCLREDREPFFRNLWFLSFVSVCPVHRGYLRTTCPACASPYDFRELHGDAGTLAQCARCKRDVRARDPKGVPPAKPAEVNVRESQGRVLSALREGAVTLGKARTVPAWHYLATMSALIALFLSKRGRRLWSRTAARMLESSGETIEKAPSLRLRALPPATRGRLIDLGVFLMDEWPRRLLDLCLMAGLQTHAVQTSLKRERLPLEEKFLRELCPDRRPFRRSVAEFLRLRSEV